MDRDGSPDFLALRVDLVTYPTHRILEAWSPARNALLWSVNGSLNNFGGYGGQSTGVAGDLDVNGDGRPDVVAMTSSTTESDVYVYDNSGSLLYVLPALAHGWIAQSLASMPDLDGDGGDDFLVGALQPGIRGGVFVVSGRTGTVLRLSTDLRQGDVLGGCVADAGDVDRDGVHDYATASYRFSPLTQIAIFSGATGAVIHSWNDYWTNDSGLVGNVDVDLDGVPDLLVGNGGYPVSSTLMGQIRAYSGRDGSVLWNYNTPNSSDWVKPDLLLNLGPRTGSPYPVITWFDATWFVQGRVVALSSQLRGAGPITGTPCANLGALPRIGMRMAPGHARITVSAGPPGALAWLVGGPASQIVFEGTSLPYALDPFGLFGCTAYVAPVVAAPAVLGSAGLDSGYAAFDLPWPVLSPSGHAFAAQWLLLDPPTGAYATTSRHEFRIP